MLESEIWSTEIWNLECLESGMSGIWNLEYLESGIRQSGIWTPEIWTPGIWNLEIWTPGILNLESWNLESGIWNPGICSSWNRESQGSN
ncbi:MAG: hypothetical protein IPN69_12560 [Acidobacteria bacterium]|nr:hypothetical protein [Acidobacteriota bacterium]